jgi:hypothetical protein
MFDPIGYTLRHLMVSDTTEAPRGTEDQFAKLGRYEVPFELSGAISASTDIGEISQVLAQRLEYVADVLPSASSTNT